MIENFLIVYLFQSIVPLKLSLRGWALCLLRIKGSHQKSKADSSSNYLTFNDISANFLNTGPSLLKNYYMSLNKDNCDQSKLLTSNVYNIRVVEWPVLDLSRLTACSVGGLSSVTYGREIDRNF